MEELKSRVLTWVAVPVTKWHTIEF
jgi:hypothetical protein